MTAITNLEAATSSHATTDASRTTYCPDVAALDDPNEFLFDFMDITFIRAVHSLPTKGAVGWRQGASLTSLSYDYYGNTNWDSVILLYNGYISESHIPPGAVINIPDTSGLKAKMRISNRGQVIRI